tara:strand:+ start:570 stop:710 length:141 start_codon:yes stop_codon:yes gene_type:complete
MLGFWEIILIAVFIAIFIGPNKIPEYLNYLKKGKKEFQKAIDNSHE